MTQEDSLDINPPSEELFQLKSKDSLTRFFTETGKTKIVENPRSNKDGIPVWIHLMLLFWVGVVIFARQTYTLRLRQIFVAVINPKQVKQLQREGNVLNQFIPVILLFLYAFTLALFAFLIINKYYPNSFYFSKGEGFLLLFVVVAFYHLAKFTLIWFSGILFETSHVSIPYLLDYYLFHISEGIILFPILILYVYSGMQLILYVAVIVLFALWIYRFQRAVIIGLGCRNFSLSYLFLYLCTLEVLPMFLLYKLSIQFI